MLEISEAGATYIGSRRHIHGRISTYHVSLPPLFCLQTTKKVGARELSLASTAECKANANNVFVLVPTPIFFFASEEKVDNTLQSLH